MQNGLFAVLALVVAAAWVFRSRLAVRAIAAFCVIVMAAWPSMGIVASHRLAAVEHFDDSQKPVSDDFLEGAKAARDAAVSQLPGMFGIGLALFAMLLIPTVPRR